MLKTIKYKENWTLLLTLSIKSISASYDSFCLITSHITNQLECVHIPTLIASTLRLTLNTSDISTESACRVSSENVYLEHVIRETNEIKMEQATLNILQFSSSWQCCKHTDAVVISIFCTLSTGWSIYVSLTLKGFSEMSKPNNFVYIHF